MRHRIRSILIAAVLALYGISANAFETITLEGTKKQFGTEFDNGKWDLVMLWSHDCIPCEKQKPMIRKFYRAFKDRGVSVYGLSTDNQKYREKAVALLKSKPTPYGNYIYSGNDFSSEYESLIGQEFLATPTYLVYDKEGNLLGAHAGTISRGMLNELFESKVGKR